MLSFAGVIKQPPAQIPPVPEPQRKAPPLEGDPKRFIEDGDSWGAVRKYSPDQPRDEQGRWSDVEGRASSGAEDRQITAYSGGDYYAINGALRSGKADKFAEEVHLMDKYTHREVAAEPFEVYRMLGDRGHSRVMSMKPGDTIDVPEFMSTSENIRGLREFLGGEGATEVNPSGLMEIVVPSGGHYGTVGSLSRYPKESEILLPRGQKLKFVGARAAKATAGLTTSDTVYRFESIGDFSDPMNMEKSQPTVGDVHAIGTGGKKRPRNFLTALAEDAEKPEATEKTKMDFERTLKVAKVAPEQRLIFGWASVTSVDGVEVIDKQDDAIQLMDSEVGKGLESAVYDFVLYSREQGHMHEKRDVGRMVESIVFTPEKEKCGLVAKNEEGKTIHGWWIGFKVFDDSVWADHRAGLLPELSIGGRAKENAA